MLRNLNSRQVKATMTAIRLNDDSKQGRLNGSFRTHKLEIGKLDSLAAQCVKGKIEPEYIHPRFAKDSQKATICILIDQIFDLIGL